MRGHIASAAGIGLMAIALVGASLFGTGCKKKAEPAPTDQQIVTAVESKLQAESALAQQNIQVGAVNGMVTLSGSVSDGASRALAANDAGLVNGVRTVVNNLVVQQIPAASQPVQPAPVATNPQPKPQAVQSRSSAYQKQMPTPQPVQKPVQAAPVYAAQAAPVPGPPKPVVKQVTLPAGTVLPVRMTENLSSQTAESNQAFHGSLASDIGIHGVIAIPFGSAVTGRIIEARAAGRVNGSSYLSLELTQVNAHGARIPLVTNEYSQQGAGRGKNTAVKAGGGAVFGSIIGALAGGGKGAAIGALAGAGAGTAANAVTHGQQVEIPSETLINFTLQSPVTLTVTIPPQGGEDRAPYQPRLQSR